jgi:hypothetical protein
MPRSSHRTAPSSTILVLDTVLDRAPHRLSGCHCPILSCRLRLPIGNFRSQIKLLVAALAKHFHRLSDLLGPDEIRQCQLYLLNERKQSSNGRRAGGCFAVLLLHDAEEKYCIRRHTPAAADYPHRGRGNSAHRFGRQSVSSRHADGAVLHRQCLLSCRCANKSCFKTPKQRPRHIAAAGTSHTDFTDLPLLGAHDVTERQSRTRLLNAIELTKSGGSSQSKFGSQRMALTNDHWFNTRA